MALASRPDETCHVPARRWHQHDTLSIKSHATVSIVTEGMQLRRNPGRRQRLTDAQTEARMLDAGVRLVAEQGLSLSLEHLSMEELIQTAGVSRASSYRRWPSKDLFTADLLLTLAGATELSGDIPGLPEALAAIPEEVFAHLDTEQGRRDAVVEVLRVVTDIDFLTMLHSADWRSYIALRAAHIGLPDGELRTRVAEALSETERRFTGTRAAAFEVLAELVGYRLRRPDPQAWQRLSLTVGAVATGMLVRGYSDPDAVLGTSELAAFDSTRPAPWSVATLAAVGVLLDAVEPDPAVVWDAERVAALRARVGDAAGTIQKVLASLR